MEVNMKTINLKNIKEIDGKSCKIVYNTGAGCYEVEVDGFASRQSLNFIIGKICKTDTEIFTIGPADKLLFDDGRVGEIIRYGFASYGIKFDDDIYDDIEYLPESFEIM
jgi:hypothetical protein